MTNRFQALFPTCRPDSALILKVWKKYLAKKKLIRRGKQRGKIRRRWFGIYLAEVHRTQHPGGRNPPPLLGKRVFAEVEAAPDI